MNDSLEKKVGSADTSLDFNRNYHKTNEDDRKLQSQRFDKVWQDVHGGFTLGSGERTTPMLDRFCKKLLENFEKNTLFKIIEAAAGNGIHAIAIAKALNKNAHVLAVDTSLKAREILDYKVAASCLDWQITSLSEDVYDVILRQDDSVQQLHGLHANSFFHILHPSDRIDIYHALFHSVIKKGIVAISFKARGDYLEKDGTLIRRVPGGVLRMGSDGIHRFFVDDPEVIISELASAGFKVKQPENDIIEWDILDYNKKDEPAKFIGLVAQKE